MTGKSWKRIKNDVGSQLALMEAKPRHNTVDIQTLFGRRYPAMQGISLQRKVSTPLLNRPCACSSGKPPIRIRSPPFGIRMVDRLTGKPVHLDISDLPMKNGTVTDRNKFILGPSGSGKSFFTNHMVRRVLRAGNASAVGRCRKLLSGLCNLIHARTHGEDGIYFTYEENNPIAFNPFYVEDGISTSRRKNPSRRLSLPCGSVMTNHRHMPRRWHCPMRSISFGEDPQGQRPETVFSNTFYEFIRDEYQDILEKKRTREKDFDVSGIPQCTGALLQRWRV